MMVLVNGVVVVVSGLGSGRDTPERTDSGVLRVCLGVWGCAFMCGGGGGVVRVVVVRVVWCGLVVVGVVTIVGCCGVGVCGGGLGVWCVYSMVVCCGCGYWVFVVVVVSWFL
jgi:hypothetical protein